MFGCIRIVLFTLASNRRQFLDENLKIKSRSDPVFYFTAPFSRGRGWADQFRSVEMNFALMSSGDFESFYGIDLSSDQGRSWVANQISSTYYYVTTDEGNYIYTDKSFQDLTGWYRAQAFTKQTEGDTRTYLIGGADLFSDEMSNTTKTIANAVDGTAYNVNLLNVDPYQVKLLLI